MTLCMAISIYRIINRKGERKYSIQLIIYIDIDKSKYIEHDTNAIKDKIMKNIFGFEILKNQNNHTKIIQELNNMDKLEKNLEKNMIYVHELNIIDFIASISKWIKR